MNQMKKDVGYCLKSDLYTKTFRSNNESVIVETAPKSLTVLVFRFQRRSKSLYKEIDINFSFPCLCTLCVL